MKQNLQKNERLSGLTHIGLLFAEGDSFISYPLRVVFRVTDESSDSPVKIIAGVSKKRFKKAVDRNRIKRLIRETYRQDKQEINMFFGEQNRCLHVAFFYISKEPAEFLTIQQKMKSALAKIMEKSVISQQNI